ncbi:hypothetical protein KQ939_08995 [Planococcus sp. CP5-4]|nr:MULTISPECIES: hypothetical protein [unclassified Planococcus (in: firmicutes)]MBU9675026.1 hypothetical protein [Planococcus sp. CP5-4_YE]MBV0910376.1 hypothetical protein [Planococcus sp. CP5-4_UN]MBW6063848.1 hypothetical protein [Planococcus sp. CP5-4]
MTKIVSKDNQENVYLFILLFVLSVITLRKIKTIEHKRKEVTSALMEPYDPNIL